MSTKCTPRGAFGDPSIRITSYAPGRLIPRHDLVDVAPDPGLPGFDRADQRVLRSTEVLGGVPVLGGIAAADMPARKVMRPRAPRGPNSRESPPPRRWWPGIRKVRPRANPPAAHRRTSG